jgi:hypothetical protein
MNIITKRLEPKFQLRTLHETYLNEDQKKNNAVIGNLFNELKEEATFFSAVWPCVI